MVEMVLESYPQMIFGLFIIISLKIKEPLNLFSSATSAASAVYGFGNILAYDACDEKVGVRISLIIYGMLATATDTLFRAFFMAYFMSIFKAYALLLPCIYALVLLILNCRKLVREENHDRVLGIFAAFTSFGCSAYGTKYLGKRIRQTSKFTFALIFLPSLCLLIYQTASLPNANDVSSLNKTLKSSDPHYS